MQVGRILTLALVSGAVALGLIAAETIGGPPLHAQPPGIKRAILLETALDGIDGKKLVMATAELAPGTAAGKHYHHGDEVVYVLEGTGVLRIDGRPDVVLRAGDSYHLPAGLAHDVRNDGATPARALVVFVVDVDKPLAVPVP